MFSALKFVAAVAIVALFGGFLLAGVLTTQQGDEMAPAAVTESPAPMTSEELLSGMVTEEVEPGVYKVVNDGVRDLAYAGDWEVHYDIVAGHDGGIYVFEPGGYIRLGGWGRSPHNSGGFDWRTVAGFPSDVGIAPDGTIWAVFDGRIYSTPWGSGDETRHLPTPVGREPIEVTSDGTVWAVWSDDSGSAVFGYHEADGWKVVGEWPFDGYLIVSDGGEVWAVHHGGWGFFAAHRFVDGAWREETGYQLRWSHPPAGVGMDGTLWGISGYGLVHFDGTEWTDFEPPDWVPEVGAWTLTEDGWVNGEGDPPTPILIEPSYWGEPHVAPDGSLWVSHQLGVMGRDPDHGGGDRVVCDLGIDGVVRFDGETWSRFLQGRCVEAMDMAADGSVWVLAADEMVWLLVGGEGRILAVDDAWDLYVITPEAVAAKEQ